MEEAVWSESREKEIAVAQKLMDDPSNYKFLYGIEKDDKLVKRGLTSQSKAHIFLDELKERDTKKRNMVRLDAKRNLDNKKISNAAFRKIVDEHSIIPIYEIVYTEKIMKPAIQKRVNSILGKKY